VQNERQTGDDTSRDDPYGAYRTQAYSGYQSNPTPVSPTGTPSNQTDDEEDEKGGILSDFSMSAVIASALAAATSFALSSKIGMAGSVIGVGVAAAASAIATQVYKGMLSASAKKIKDLANSSDDDLTQPMPDQVGRADAGSTTVRPAATELTRDLTQPLSQTNVAETGTPIAPESLRERASKRHSKKVAKGTVAVLAVVSIVAVLVYAAIVSVATQGKGIGTTTAQTTTVTDEEATDQTTGDQGNGTPAKPEDTKAKQDDRQLRLERQLRLDHDRQLGLILDHDRQLRLRKLRLVIDHRQRLRQLDQRIRLDLRRIRKYRFHHHDHEHHERQLGLDPHRVKSARDGTNAAAGA
jgi:hypothetical protein